MIIVGVLAALSGDAWLQAREERRAEARHLVALREDVEESHALLDESNHNREALFMSLKHLATSDLGRAPRDSLANWVYAGLFNVAGFEPRLAALRDLQTSDQLRVLAPRVRREIAELDRRLASLGRVENDFLRSQQGILDPYLVTRTPLAAILTTADTLPLALALPSSASWSALQTQELQNAIAFKLSLGKIATQRRGDVARQFEVLIAVIDERLDELRPRLSRH